VLNGQRSKVAARDEVATCLAIGKHTLKHLGMAIGRQGHPDLGEIEPASNLLPRIAERKRALEDPRVRRDAKER